MFEGVTTGTPVSLMIRNEDQRSKDYGEIKDAVPARATPTSPTTPNTACATIAAAAASSARETASRVAAGAIARKILGPDIKITGYLVQIGADSIDRERLDLDQIERNPFWCPDAGGGRALGDAAPDASARPAPRSAP